MQWNSKKDGIVIVAVIGILCFMGVVMTICYVTGIWVPFKDARVTELGLCLDSAEYAPIQAVPTDVDPVYLCGSVEGTTDRSGTLYIFYDDLVVFQTGVSLAPGLFSLPLSPKQFDSFAPGSYRAEIWYAKLVIAQTQFRVVSD